MLLQSLRPRLNAKTILLSALIPVSQSYGSTLFDFDRNTLASVCIFDLFKRTTPARQSIVDKLIIPYLFIGGLTQTLKALAEGISPSPMSANLIT